MIHSLKLFGISVVVSAVLGISAHAAFWRGELPGGVYMVSLPTVASVSTHEYVVDGVARVTELTVATNSAVVARFYFLEPMVPKSPIGLGQSVIDKVQQRGEEAAGRTGVEEIWKKVVKNYPLTTHAHTVEYRVDSVDQIKRLQKSLEDAWRNNRDTLFKIADENSDN